MSWIESRPDQFGGFDIGSLRVDQAFINFTSNLKTDVWLYELSADCLKCPYRLLSPVGKAAGETVIKISTAFAHKYRFRTSDKELVVPEDEYDPYQVCDINHDFGEFGVYEVEAKEIYDKTCRLEVLLEPVNIYLPLLLIFFFIVLVDLLVYLSRNYHVVLPKLFCNKKFTNLKPPFVDEPLKSSRLISLDAFRGLCILMMIFVHDGGASYRFMQHATWDGLQVADIIFPWFLWIMGVCIPISLKGQYKKQIPTKTILKKAAVRGLKLFLLGLFMGTIGGTPTELKTYRLFGVLQRFGITYFLCTLLAIWCLKDRFRIKEEIHYHRNSFIEFKKLHKVYTLFKDIILLWKGWLVVLLAVALHTLLIFLMPVPDCPTGYLGPGGLHNNAAQPRHCIGGVAGYIDRKIWSEDHLFFWAGANEVYNEGAGVNFDPEGTLGYLTTLLQVWVGVQTGFTFITYPEEPLNILGRLGFRVVLQGLIGGLLCNWQQTGGWIPVNKNLWSLSYVLVTNAMAIVLLGVMYVAIDLYKVWTGSPLMEAGKNSIFLYVVHLTVQKTAPWHWTYGNMDTHFLKLVESTWGISLWVLMAVWMHRKKIYYKV